MVNPARLLGTAARREPATHVALIIFGPFLSCVEKESKEVQRKTGVYLRQRKTSQTDKQPGVGNLIALACKRVGVLFFGGGREENRVGGLYLELTRAHHAEHACADGSDGEGGCPVLAQDAEADMAILVDMRVLWRRPYKQHLCGRMLAAD